MNLLKEISEGTELQQTEQVAELQADIGDLLSLIIKVKLEFGSEILSFISQTGEIQVYYNI